MKSEQRGRPANITPEQVMAMYREILEEKKAHASPDTDVTVTPAEIHKRLETTASHTTVAKYLSRGLALLGADEPFDSAVGLQVRDTFVRAGMDVVSIIQAHYERLQSETQQKCIEEVALANSREERAWAQAEQLEEQLASRDQRIGALVSELQELKEKHTDATRKIEGLETLVLALDKEKSGWISELKVTLQNNQAK